MVGITLSSEQVRNAPREVRQWLEHEVLASFGWQIPATQPSTLQLTACTPEDAFKALSLIREMIPVVNVFFELGHPGASVSGQGLEVFRLADIQRHARLAGTHQVEACLQTINEAIGRARNDADAAFYALDERGHCFIAEQTRQSIAQVWQQVIAERNLEPTVQQQSTPAPVGTAASYPVWTATARPGGGSAIGGRLQV